MLTVTVTYDWPENPEHNSVDVHTPPFARLGGLARTLTEDLVRCGRSEHNSTATVEYSWMTMRVILREEPES